jgi:hypothetical protein
MSDRHDSEVVDLLIVPANRATAADLDAISSGTRGAVSKCRCQSSSPGVTQRLVLSQLEPASAVPAKSIVDES